MTLRPIALLAAIALAAGALAPIALAQEELGHDPWVGEAEGGIDPAALGADDDKPEDQPALPTRLFRCQMNALESARYSAAELTLQRGDPKGAIARLTELLEATKREGLRDVTNLNLGLLHDAWLHDHATAAKHYRAVGGILRHGATRLMLRMLVRAGKPDEAAKAADDIAAKAAEKGDKGLGLATLHRLALTFKRHGSPHHALAVYERIARDYTPDILRQMTEAIEREVAEALQQVQRLQRADRGDEAERLLERLQEARPQELRAAGRWDELAAFEKALEKGMQRLEALEREAAEREERGADAPPKKADF